MLYQQIFENRISNLKSKKMLLAKELEEFPKGSLECNKDGDRYRWYVYVDKQRKALSKRKDQELAAQFLNKMQLQCELDAVSAEIMATKNSLRRCRNLRIRICWNGWEEVAKRKRNLILQSGRKLPLCRTKNIQRIRYIILLMVIWFVLNRK